VERHADDLADVRFVVYDQHPAVATFTPDKKPRFELVHGDLLVKGSWAMVM
jgi:hypothetical protein